MKKTRKVWTPSGQQYGQMNSLVGKGESIINYNTGKATLVTKGKVGVDNQPSSVSSYDDNVIAGNDKDWMGYRRSPHRRSKGPQTFAQEVAPITAQIEKINALEKKFQGRVKQLELDSLARQTADIFSKGVSKAKQPLLQAAKKITDRQQAQHELEDQYEYLYRARCGKDVERFNEGDDDITWEKQLNEQVVIDNAPRFNWFKYQLPPINTNTKGLYLSSDVEPRSFYMKPDIPSQAKKDKISIPAEVPYTLPDEYYRFFDDVAPEEKIKKVKTPKEPRGPRTTPKWLQGFKDIKGEDLARYGAYGLPMALNALQANYWRNQDVHTPNIYAANPYERHALNTSAGLRINPYPIAREIRDSERRNAYAINRAGGLSGSQRYAALAAQSLGTQANIAKMFSDLQEQNNAYRSTYANSLLTAGAQDAQRRQSANQYGAESYDRAASRKATNYWKSMAGLGTAAQQAFANEFKYKTYKDMMKLYNQELSLQEQELLKKYGK